MPLALWLLLMAQEEDDLLKSLLFGKQKELEEGRTYLTKEKKPDRAVAYFRKAIESGFRPLYVTRQHPNHVPRAHAGKEIRVVWLSTTLGKEDRKSTRLNSSHQKI